MIYEKIDNSFDSPVALDRPHLKAEQRSDKRSIVNLKGVFVCGDSSYVGLIENISANGLYIITLPTRYKIDFSRESLHEAHIRISGDETIKLTCRIKWAYDTPPYGLTKSIGMEILNPSGEFLKFLDSLS